jgi:glutamate synthase (NADPH) small chain
MDYLTQQNRLVVAGDPVPPERASTPPASASSSSAAATPAPTAWAPRTARARRSSPRSSFCPARPIERAPNNPWPQWPLIFRTSSSQEEGGDREFALLTKR